MIVASGQFQRVLSPTQPIHECENCLDLFRPNLPLDPRHEIFENLAPLRSPKPEILNIRQKPGPRVVVRRQAVLSKPVHQRVGRQDRLFRDKSPVRVRPRPPGTARVRSTAPPSPNSRRRTALPESVDAPRRPDPWGASRAAAGVRPPAPRENGSRPRSKHPETASLTHRAPAHPHHPSTATPVRSTHRAATPRPSERPPARRERPRCRPPPHTPDPPPTTAPHTPCGPVETPPPGLLPTRRRSPQTASAPQSAPPGQGSPRFQGPDPREARPPCAASLTTVQTPAPKPTPTRALSCTRGGSKRNPEAMNRA